MNNNLIIVGAGGYGLVAKEIAVDMGCFDSIVFVDDSAKETPDGTCVVGTTEDLTSLSKDYDNVVVAIGNATVRRKLITKIKEETSLSLVTLLSPFAYLSPSAQVGEGSIIEPMAVVHTKCILGKGCLISANAVVSHGSVCEDFVHVDCNATVPSYAQVFAGTTVPCGSAYINVMHTPVEIEGLEYCFESGM